MTYICHDPITGKKITKENPQLSPFGANLYDLLHDGFYLQKGEIGDLAQYKINSVIQFIAKTRLVRNGFPAGLDPFPYEPFAALIQKQLGTHIYSLGTNVYSKYPNEAATVLHGLRLARNGFQTILNTLPCELIVTMVQK